MSRLKRFNQGLFCTLAALACLSIACTALRYSAEPIGEPATPLFPTSSLSPQPTGAQGTPPNSPPGTPPPSAKGSRTPPLPTADAGGGPGSIALVKGRIRLLSAQDAEEATITVNRISDLVTAETVAEGLEVPWALAFTPDRRMLVTERPGRIRVIQNARLLEQPLAILDVASVSEAGLMGIAVDPNFGDNGHLYVCYTNQEDSGGLFNRIARLTDSGGRAGDLKVMLDHIPAAGNHNGCRIRFGPDGKLYVTMGDAQSSLNAQNLNSLSGKILRLERDGSVPADNPYPDSYIYSYGHRNPQGLDWHPESGGLFITEHGPHEDDEINILAAGGNYGWPHVTGRSARADYLDPILAFTPTIALAGAAFYTGESLATSWDGDFIFATLKGSHLRRISLQPPEFRSVASDQILFAGEFGRLRAVALGPDGYIYFSTSNRDGRGRPFSGDDKILRLIPVESEPPLLVQPTGQGNFSIELEPGTYQLGIAAPGYAPYQRRLVVEAGGLIDLGVVRLELREGAADSQ